MKLCYILGQTKAFVDTFQAKPFQTQVPNCPPISLTSLSPRSSSSSFSSFSFSSTTHSSNSSTYSSNSCTHSSDLSTSSAPFIPSDEYLECVAKTLTGSFSSAAGTDRMGSINDEKTVVSSELKVHGVRGLKVIDSSVCPQTPSGALYAAVLMIAEKGVQYVLNDFYKY
jgi:choline dehydrogenase-like flavoprotein